MATNKVAVRCLCHRVSQLGPLITAELSCGEHPEKQHYW